MANSQANAAILALSGLTALAVGAALWLFPLLPAVTIAGARPHFAWAPQLGLGLAIAGTAILGAGRRISAPDQLSEAPPLRDR